MKKGEGLTDLSPPAAEEKRKETEADEIEREISIP